MTTFCPNFSNKQVKKEFTELKKLFGEDWSYLLWHRNHGYSVDLTTKGSSSPLFQWFMVLNGGNRDAALRDTATALLKDYKKWKDNISFVQKEMQAIKERAIADGTFMKAPNGKPTNLTEQQWLQVRTKAFKDWFGDWEGAYRWVYRLYDIDKAFLKKTERDKLIEDFNNGKDVVIYAGSDNIKQLLNGVDFRKTGVGLNRTEGVFYASYSLGYAQDYANMYALRGDDLNSIGVAKIIINKQNIKGGITFDESEIRITNPALIKSIEDITGTKNLEKVRVANRKAKDVSKVVDKNGEPLVVWHGSKISNKITVFNNIPTYFANRYTASSYTPFEADDETEYMYPVFLNIRNPKQVDGKGAFWNNINGMTTDDIVKSINEEDGAIISNIKDYSDFAPGNPDLSRELMEDAPLHTDYIITNPNQIKSATDNNGEFSNENDDIHYLMGKVQSRIKKHTVETYDFVSYMQKMLTVRFGSTIGNKFTKFIYKELEDVNENGVKNIEKLYDKIDFYFNNVLQNDVLNSLNELSGKNQATPIKKGYYGDFIIKLINHLKNKEITGNLDEDAKLFGNEVLDLLKDLMPKLYNPKNHLGKLRGLYIKRLSDLLNDPYMGRNYLFLMINKFNNNEYARRNKIKTLKKLKDKVNSKVLFDRIFKRAVISDVLNYLKSNPEYSHNEETTEKIPTVFEILEKDVLAGNEDGKTTDGNLMYSVKGILKKIKNNHPKYSALCDLILNNVDGDIRAEIREIENSSATAYTLGHYFEGNYYQFIRINKNDLDVFYENPEYALLHEIIHSVTQKFLNDNPSVKDAIKNYMKYIATSPVSGYRFISPRDEILLEYGMSIDKNGEFDPHEFIAEFFTNDVFRDLLTRIPAQDEKQFNNIFEQIWDYIVRLFTGKSENAFELILPVMRSILEAGINSTEYRDLLEHIDFNLTDNEDLEDGYNHERALESINDLYERSLSLLSASDREDIAQKHLKKYLPPVTERVNITTEDPIMSSTGGPTISLSTMSNALQNINNAQNVQDEIAKKIANLFKILYQSYERMPNKTPRRQQIQNEIFETLSKLKKLSNNESLLTALSHAILLLGSVDNTSGQPSSTSGLYNWLLRSSKQLNPFSNITPTQLVDAFQYGIGFYIQLDKDLPPSDAPGLTREVRDMIDEFRAILPQVYNLWKQATVITGSRTVDEIIDENVVLDKDVKERHKQVTKDFLTKNFQHGDISIFHSYILNFGHSTNPVVKHAFHEIGYAELAVNEEMFEINNRLFKALRKADRLWHLRGKKWQWMFMEKDRNGIPTGLFIRPINYGQYRLDLDEFIQKLNDEFDEDFGHHYYYDELGNAYNSATDEPASNETWEGPNSEYIEPDYIYYLKRIEQWKCEHAERRYTREYYLERLSIPYNGEEDPQHARFGSQFNHGLSPMTLLEHDRILKNINYYLSLCTDENGYVRIEKLDPDSRAKLQMWRDLMEDLQNPFNLDGTYKDGDDLKMAFELRAWNKWVNENTDTYVDMNAFEEESNKIYKECQETGDFTPYNDFYKYNTRIAIHPHFLRQTLGLFDGETAAVNGEASPEAVRAKLLRQSLESLVKTPTGRTKDLQSKERNFIFWTFCKIADQEYADAEKGKHSKEFAETMDHYFKHSEIEYRDEYGRARDIYGNVVAPEDEENTVLLTYRSYLINMFVKEIMDTGTIAGYLDENGQPISNITGTEEEIRDFVEDMFAYTETYTDEHGQIVEKQRPLSIFTLFTPRQDTFVDLTTGKTEKTIQDIPTGRFSHKYGHLVNHKYDIKDSNAEQPKRDLYDNSKAYNKVMDNENTRELYETMIDIMKYSQRQYNSKNTIFNYQLPKMNASAGAMWTRLFADVIRGKKSFLDKFKTLWSYWSEVQPDDDFVYVGKDQRNPDGTYGNNIPLKLVGLLEDRSTYTADLVGAVSAFADMALNFREKNKIIDKLKVLEYNLQDEVRDYNTETGRNKFNTAKNSAELFKQMMASHMYGNEALADPTKNTGLRMMTRKAAVVFKMIETMLMLALNVMSFSVGGGDAIFKLILYSATNKYQNLYNLTIGLLNTIKALPQILLNIGNPIPANKTGAMMKLFGISKTAKQSAKHSNWGRVSKIIPQILMGGFSMVDYFINAVSLRTTMSACRFYGGMKDGNGKEIIKPGFYTRYQLKQAFRDAGLKNPTMRSTAAHLFSTTSMWDAFNWNWMSHTLTVKDKYKPYINAKNKTLMHTLNMQRNALQNGMNPDNDQNKLHKNMATRMLMGMRFFLMQMYQHLMLQGDETTVREMVTKPKKKIVHGKERYMGEEVYKSKMTDEQRNQRVRWNAETGQPEDQIFVGLTRCISTLSKKFARLITGNIKGAKSIKFSNVEKYAARDALIFACMMAALHMGIVAVTNAAFSTYVPPEDRREAGPESISDVPRYMREQYIGNNGYMIQLADFMFRTYEAQLTGINPSTTMDFITSLTVFKGGLDQLLRGFDLLADYMHWSDYDMNDPVKQGGFKHYARWERDVHNMFGPLRNLHTSFTTEGLKANMRYYVNNYGWTFKITGTDLSKMMTPEKKTKKKKSNDDLGLDLDLDLDLDMDLDIEF